eukprot:711128_1
MQYHLKQLLSKVNISNPDTQHILDLNSISLGIQSKLHSSSSTLVSVHNALQKCVQNKFYLNNLRESDFNYYLIVHLSGFEHGETHHLLRIQDHSGAINALFTHSISSNMMDAILLIQSFNIISYQKDKATIHYVIEINSNCVHLIHPSFHFSQFNTFIHRTMESHPSNQCNIKGICASRSTILSSSDASIPLFFAEFTDVTVYYKSNSCINAHRVKVIFEKQECMFWNTFLMVNRLYLIHNVFILNPANPSNQTELLLKFQCPTIHNKQNQTKTFYRFSDYYPFITPRSSNHTSWIIQLPSDTTHRTQKSVMTHLTQQTMESCATQKSKQHKAKHEMLLFSQRTVEERMIYPPIANHNKMPHTQAEQVNPSVHVYLPTGYTEGLDELQFGSLMLKDDAHSLYTEQSTERSCIHYEGTIRKVHADLVLCLEDRIKVYLCKHMLPNACIPVGFRCGSTIRLYHGHLIWRDNQCVGIGCCAYTVIELVSLSNISMPQKLDVKSNTLCSLHGVSVSALHDRNSILSLYYRTQPLHKCIDILNLTRLFKKKFGRIISTEAILGTKRYCASKSKSKHTAIKPIIEYFGAMDHSVSVNEQFFLNHSQCTLYNDYPLSFPFAWLISLDDAVLNDDRVRQCIECMMDKKNWYFEVFASVSELIVILQCGDKGYFELYDTSLVIPVYLMNATNISNYISHTKKCLLRIKRYEIGLIRTRQCSMSLMSPSHGKSYNIGKNSTCVLWIDWNQCDVIHVIHGTNNKPNHHKTIGKKRTWSSVLNMEPTNGDNNVFVQSVSMLLHDAKSKGIYFTLHVQHKTHAMDVLKCTGSVLRLYPIFNSCIQCRVTLNTNPLPNSFMAFIMNKKWILKQNMELMDRLFVIIKQNEPMVSIIDIPHSNTSTFLVSGMTVQFYGFKCSDDHGLPYYVSDISSNWICHNIQTMQDGLNDMSLTTIPIIPFALCYELPLDNTGFYGKIIRFSHCKIADILCMQVCLKCFNCNEVWLKNQGCCPRCTVFKQIIGVYCELHLLIDDGSSSCVLIKEYNDVHTILNLSKMQHVRLIHRLKDNGALYIKLENNINIIDAIYSDVMWENLVHSGIKKNGICKGIAYIVSHEYKNSDPSNKPSRNIKCKHDEALNKWMNDLNISHETLSIGYGYGKQSVSVLKRAKLVLKCIHITAFDTHCFDSEIDLLLKQMSNEVI